MNFFSSGHFEIPDHDFAHSIQQTKDGGYIVAGSAESNNGDVTGHHGQSWYADYWIVKLDSYGNLQWQKSLGGSSYDYSGSIQQTNDGGYIVAGNSQSSDGDVTVNHGGNNYGDYWIVKLDSYGNLQWQKSLGGTNDEALSSIQQTNDGGYIVAGYSDSNNGDVSGNHSTNYDYWIIKLDSIGNLQWQKCLGGTDNDKANSIQQTNDGGYIIAGSSNSNNGDVTGNHGNNDYWIVKLGPYPMGIKEEKITQNEVLVYPNPANSSFTVEVPGQTNYIEVSNSLGQVIEKKLVNKEKVLNFTIKENGLYFIKIVTEKEIITKKLIINN